MVTISSALSSSSEATMRFKRSLCGAGLATLGAAAFFGFGLEDLLGFGGFGGFLTASWSGLLGGLFGGLFGGFQGLISDYQGRI